MNRKRPPLSEMSDSPFGVDLLYDVIFLSLVKYSEVNYSTPEPYIGCSTHFLYVIGCCLT